jgi:predicted anti-sigma-YlaC factor YlaD
MLDGEAAAPDVAHIAHHLRGCTCCRQFAAVVADFTHDLRATPVEHPRTRNRVKY